MAIPLICPRQDVPISEIDSPLISRSWWLYFNNLARAALDFESLFVTPQQFGAKGDGATDDTSAFQAAAAQENKSVFIPNGSYVISDTITVGPNQRWIGASRDGVIVTMTVGSKFAFQYFTAILTAPYDVEAGLAMTDFSLVAKNGIKINQNIIDIGVGPFDNQGFFKGPVFNNLKLTGTYGAAVDPDYGTAVVPTLAALRAFGVAIEWNKVFDAMLSGCQIQDFGIGLLEGGSDLNQIMNNRFHENARHRHVRGFITGYTTLGSQDLMQHCDILRHRRIYGIYLDRTNFQMFTDCYFENSITACATVFATANDLGTELLGNRFDGSFGATVPFFDLDPRWGMSVIANKWADGGAPYPFVTVRSTYWDNSHPQQILWVDNDSDMPEPDAPEAFLAPADHYLMRYNNHGPLTGAALVTFPWALSAVTGRWSVKVTNPTFIWQAHLKTCADRKLLLEYVARRISSTGTANVRYVEDNMQCTANAGTDTITAVGHGKVNDDQIRFRSTQTLPGGILANTNYYVINAAANTLQISTSLAGPAVNITSAGTGTIYLQNWWQLCVLPLGLTSTTATATKQHTVRLPLVAKGIGYIEGEIANDTIELESIQIIPVGYELGVAAPVAGTYELAEVVYNTAPTIGGPRGWVCTVAGTPGTWEQFGIVGVPLLVPQGGSGSTTLAANGVLIGQATAAVHVTDPGTVGQVLTSGGAGVDPTFQANAASSLPVVDTTAIVKGSSDATKLVRIEADGLTTATTRVATMPDRDITLNQLETLNATASGNLTLTNAYQDITGDTVTLNKTGKWLITATVTFTADAASGGVAAQLLVAGSAYGAAMQSDVIGTYTLMRTWLATGVTSGDVAKIQAKKNGGAGVSTAFSGSSDIVAVFLG